MHNYLIWKTETLKGICLKEFKVKEIEKYDYLIIKELVKLWLKSDTKQFC